MDYKRQKQLSIVFTSFLWVECQIKSPIKTLNNLTYLFFVCTTCYQTTWGKHIFVFNMKYNSIQENILSPHVLLSFPILSKCVTMIKNRSWFEITSFIFLKFFFQFKHLFEYRGRSPGVKTSRLDFFSFNWNFHQTQVVAKHNKISQIWFLFDYSNR